MDNISIKVSMVLKKLHIGPHRKGYTYLRETLEIMLDSRYMILKDIYLVLSKKYKTSVTAIENAVRRSIKEGILECPNEIKIEVFGYDVMVENRSGRDYYKTKEFIPYVLDYIKNMDN